MQSTGVAAVTAFTAHREWATRPPDERFASVSALYEAARVRRDRTEERIIETSQIRTEAPTADALVLREPSGQTAASRTGASSSSPASPARRPIPPHAARVDRVQRDQLRAASAAPRRASALRGSRRTVDRPRGHLSEVRAGPPRRVGGPCARPHGRAPGLAAAARLQGRRLWR